MGALEHVEAWCEGAYKYYLMKFVYIHRWCIVVKNKQRKKTKTKHMTYTQTGVQIFLLYFMRLYQTI